MLLAMEDYAIATRLMPSKTEALFKHGLHYFNNGFVFLYWLVSFNFYIYDAAVITYFAGLFKIKTSYLYRNWQSAIHDFTELLKQDPQDSRARTYRGRSYAKLQQWNAAVEDLSAAIHLNPKNSIAFYFRGCILRK